MPSPITSPLGRTLGLAAMAAVLCGAAPKPGDYVSFVTCPIIRDTPELPCWMARKNGTLLYLGIQEGRKFQSEWYQPQLKHKALVEGYISAKPKVCGGLPLEKMHVSDLPEVSLECNEWLPRQGYVSPKGRPVGPDPANIPGAQMVVRGPPAGGKPLFTDADVAARAPKRFDILYNFDSDLLVYPQEHHVVGQIQAYAHAIKAGKVRVTAHRGVALLDNGQVLPETQAVIGWRRDKVVKALEAYAIPAGTISAEVRTEPEPAKGEGDYQTRRVTVEVLP